MYNMRGFQINQASYLFEAEGGGGGEARRSDTHVCIYAVGVGGTGRSG